MKNIPVSQRIKSGCTVNEVTGCWEWNRYCDRDGYGRIGIGRSIQSTHRVAYSLFVGPIPDGMTIDHLCRNRKCINPSHLEAVTRRENTMRGESVIAKHARQSHCIAGHPLSGENLYRWRGSRICRTCRDIASRTYREKKAVQS